VTRLSAFVGSTAPTLLFVGVSLVYGVWPAVITASAMALLVLFLRLVRRQAIRHAVIGLALLAVCAAGVGLTGEARGFFLAPTLIPAAVILVCLGSIIVRRPLAGIVVNRLVRGPRNWFDNQALRRVYTIATVVCIAINIINGSLQAVFYLASNTIVLAVIHAATGPVFATVVAGTAVLARREIRKQEKLTNISTARA
jgi:hypothetical protein